MRVLHISRGMAVWQGGPPFVISGIVEKMVKRGIDVSIFATHKEGEKMIIPKGADLRLFERGFMSKIWAAYAKGMYKALKEEIYSYDLIHIHEPWHYPNFIAYRAAKKFDKPYIISPHGAFEEWCLNHKALRKKIFYTLFQEKILKEADFIHAISKGEAQNLHSLRINDNICIIPNGINTEEFNVINELNSNFKLHDKMVVLFLGRIHPKKGLHILAKAWGKIAKDRKDVVLAIAGSGNYGYIATIKEILRSEGVIDKTVFLGMVTGQNKAALLRKSDLYVLPSYSETLGIATMEAMYNEVPVIITSNCNFPEVAEANAGIVIEPDVEQLVIALEELLNDENLRKRMGENGKKLVMEKYTWDKIVDQFIELYKSVLEEL